MARFVFIDAPKDGDGDWYTEEHDTLETAEKALRRAWGYLTDAEKSARELYVIESENPDVDAPNHFDGNPVAEVD